ncbi:hypothetical protein NPIL_101261 [Nephila pilipes]|uniref:Uncharacterized protein n=1 Tax=Nephila pilipes TaxID=299642 RepID=A0A8X6TN00_NEPPI|nr:hypothetical protein NPIL_101261 [Nephila pilipes]
MLTASGNSSSVKTSCMAKKLLSPQNKDELCARVPCCEIMGLPTRIPLGERNPPTNSLFSLKRVGGNLTRPRGHGQRYDYFWTIRFGGTATSFTYANLTSGEGRKVIFIIFASGIQFVATGFDFCFENQLIGYL